METAITILLDGLVFSSYLFLVSVGLTIIFGVMKILNVAHGSLYAWGAYTSAYLIGVWSEAGFGDAGTFLMIAVAALVVGCVLGFVLERGLIQFMYARDEVIVVLATFATFLILEDVILLVFGVDPYFAYQPMAYLGSAELGGILRDVYSLTLIGLAAVVGIVLWVGLTQTRWGKLLAAVIHDRELSVAMGIDVTKVYVLTFMLGAVLGALGGAYVAPMVSVAPGFGVEVIVLSFAVVVIGGMGSIPGAAIGALVVGIARAIAVHKLPEVELFVVYGVMAVVLVFRPEGLFAPASARKI
ncbi:inner-membrane translocator [alpha proteobacterium BAL199]|jgi:branched-chain amino acid transport system permease protein|nr:inner-membrane translocator [alpha proteobacterium BAL199]